jgi:predicted nucleic acid-binding protein
MPTVDANCWIATFDPLDAFHTPSRELFQRLADREVHIEAPEIVLLEVGCAVARRHRDPAQGVRAISVMQRNPLLRLFPHSEQLLAEAMRLGTQQYLRGADALYAATAHLTGSTLVTWDNELIQRAGAITPTDWLNATP